MIRNPFLISSLIVAFSILGCGKSDSSTDLSALALAGGGGGGGNSDLTLESAPAAATAAAVENAIQAEAGAFQLPSKSHHMLALSKLPKQSTPYLTMTGLTQSEGSCNSSGGSVTCTDAVLTGSASCMISGTMTITPSQAGGGLRLSMTAVETDGDKIGMNVTQELNNAKISYDNCGVAFTDPVTQKLVLATLNGDIIEMLSQTTINVTSSTHEVVNGVSTGTMSYSSNGSDDITLSGFAVNGTSLNGSLTTQRSFNITTTSEVYSISPDKASIKLTVQYGPNSLYKVNGEVKADFSGRTESISGICTMVGGFAVDCQPQ